MKKIEIVSNGQYIAGFSPHEVNIVGSKTGKIIFHLSHINIDDWIISPHRKNILTVSRVTKDPVPMYSIEQRITVRTDVKLWDVETGKKLLSFKSNGPLKVQYSSDGEKLAIGSWDGTIFVWDTKTGEKIYETKPETTTLAAIKSKLKDDIKQITRTVRKSISRK